MTSDDECEMKMLLLQCKRLPKWVKNVLQHGYDGEWFNGNEGHLYLDG